MTRVTFTQRPPFDSLPAEVRTALADELGVAVISSKDCLGGMSPAAAAVLRLSDGRQVFAKVVSAEVSQPSTLLYDRELGVLPLLGEHVPHSRFLGELRLGPWRGVITEAVPGGPPGPPWTVESVDATLAALDAFGTAPAGLRTAGESWSPVTEPRLTLGKGTGWTSWLRWRPTGRPGLKVTPWSIRTCAATTR